MVSLPISLPSGVTILVKEGETVKKGQILAQREASAEHIIHLADALRINPENVPDTLLKGPGDKIEKGEIIAMKKKSFGFSKVKLQSNISGMITRFDEETGDLTVGGELGNSAVTEILCPIDGVVQVCNNDQIVIQTKENVVQGVGGTGATTRGTLYVLPAVKDREINQQQVLLQLNSAIRNSIVVARILQRDALIKAIGLESLGIIATEILPEDIEYLVQRNMVLPIVLVTEEQLPMLIKAHGKQIYLDGSTNTVLLLE